jgi:hypothetical protein
MMRELINLFESVRLPLPATVENVTKAHDFVFEKWKERARENRREEPLDLSFSCKFSSMFAQRIFGGEIQGNYDHQFLRLDNGEIVDLNKDAADVQAIVDDDEDPYHHDDDFFGSPDHRDSMDSCQPRVDQWVDEFTARYS